jgi:hypothetical protein
MVEDFWLWSICKLILGCAVSAGAQQAGRERLAWLVLTKKKALATLAVAVLFGSLVENAKSRATLAQPA